MHFYHIAFFDIYFFTIFRIFVHTFTVFFSICTLSVNPPSSSEWRMASCMKELTPSLSSVQIYPNRILMSSRIISGGIVPSRCRKPSYTFFQDDTTTTVCGYKKIRFTYWEIQGRKTYIPSQLVIFTENIFQSLFPQRIYPNLHPSFITLA